MVGRPPGTSGGYRVHQTLCSTGAAGCGAETGLTEVAVKAQKEFGVNKVSTYVNFLMF